MLSPFGRTSGVFEESFLAWCLFHKHSGFEVAPLEYPSFYEITLFILPSRLHTSHFDIQTSLYPHLCNYPARQFPPLHKRPLFVPDLRYLGEDGNKAWWRHCNPHVLDRWCESSCQNLASCHFIPISSRFDANPCVLDRPLPLRGQRIGEALNPGPTNLISTFAIVNPTSMDNKEHEFAELCTKYNVDTVACSETTATIEVQAKTSSRFRHLGMNSVWSPPVEPQRICKNEAPSLRGKVGGTSIHSKFPIRSCRNPPKNPTSTRMVHSILSLGPLNIQCIVLYGLTRAVGGSKDFTNQLIKDALEDAGCIPLPLLLLGDFNHDIHTLDIFGTLQEQGFMSLQQKYQMLYGCSMPFTCKGATCPDTAILHPDLHKLLLAIGVDKSHLFDTHDPVIFTMQIPQTQIFHQTIRFPESWVQVPVETDDLAAIEDEVLGQQVQPTTLQQWGSSVEQLVSKALEKNALASSTTPLLNHLPKRFRGRCQPKKVVLAPVFATTKRGRVGDYEPAAEPVNVSSRALVRQTRRVQSLIVRVKKLDSYQEIWHRTIIALNQEWHTIQKQTMQGMNFWEWVAQFPELEVTWDSFPSLDWLSVLGQLLKHHTDIQVNQDLQVKQKYSKFCLETDAKVGHHKKAFAVARGSPLPPFTSISTKVEQKGVIELTERRNEYIVQVPEPEKFSPFDSCWVDDKPIRIKSIDIQGIKFEALSTEHAWPDEAIVTQKVKNFDLHQVFRELTNYWIHFWQREPQEDQILTLEQLNYLQELKTMVPKFPDDFECAADDVSEWQAAIKSSRKNSAPGIDGITFAEFDMIPPKYLKNLIEIVNNLDSFPEWFMIAKTIPLPKVVDGPSASESRPITILPTIYRLWAKVTCTKLIRYLGTVLPSEITGFLPGRGAMNATYIMQSLFETAGIQQDSISGLTLDLKKCFNLMNRQRVAELFRNFKIPEAFIKKWISSLKVLTRYWQINKHISTRITATTGFPEGDPCSVVAMLIVAATWVIHIKKDNLSIGAGAYADNWTWWTKDAELHSEILHTTQNICNFCGLEIDWGKTWIWSTTSTGHKPLARLLHQQTGHSIDVKRNATDLGSVVAYHGPQILGKQKKRIDEAFARLQRIQRAPWNFDVKCHIVNTSVYPTAFYGSELLVIGISHLDKLSSAIVDALIGAKTKSVNPAIFLHCAHHQLIDPRLYVILKAVKLARHYLITTTESKRQAFIQILTTPVKTTGVSKGPASALREYLLRLGVTCDREYNLLISASIKCNFLKDSFATIARFLHLAWQEDLLLLMTQRVNLFGLPPVSRIATLQVLKKFPPQKRLLLLREIAGAFQTEHQKMQWDQTVEDTCPWCGNIGDDRYHRLLHCPAFAEIRAPFQPLIDNLIEQESHLPILPVMHKHPHHELHIAVHYAMPEAIIEPQLIEQLQSHHNGILIHFYTDGSCQYPSSIETRYASYSIIVDLCKNDAERRYHAKNFQTSGIPPPTLQKVAVSRLTGEQVIHRAELLAIVKLFESFDNFVVHSDSDCSVKLVQRCHEAISLFEFVSHKSFDLIRRLWPHRTNTRRVEKIRAHVDLTSITDLLHCYHSLGNKLANDEAILARDQLLPPVVQQCQELHADFIAEEKQLTEFYDWILVLQQARAKADKPSFVCNEPPIVETVDKLQQAIVTYQAEFFFLQGQVDDRWLQHSAWGLQVTRACISWMRSCKWPNDETEPAGYHLGFSWTEMAIAISLHFGNWLPVKKLGSDTREYVFQPKSHQDALHTGITLADITRTATHLWQHVQALTPTALVPKIQKGKVKSLNMQGCPFWTTGLKKRPSYPRQQEVFEVLQRFWPQMTGWLTGLPDIVFPEGWYTIDEDNNIGAICWDDRLRLANNRMKEVGRIRRGVG